MLYSKKDFERLTVQLVRDAQSIWDEEAEKHQAKDDNQIKHACAGLLLSVLEWSCRYKNKKWKHEREWRLRSDPASLPGVSVDVAVRVRGSQLVPYTEFQLWEPAKPKKRSAGVQQVTMPQVPIREIVLGPLQDEEAGKLAVQALWESLHLQRSRVVSEMGERDLHRVFAKVRKSTIEYRQV